MKIGILLTDELRDTLRPHFDGSYADMFLRLLDGNGFDFHVYDVREGDYPANPSDCAGYLITGSRHGAYEDLAWMPPLFAFIRDLHQQKIPLLGVCFGHQVVAQALGGRVEKSEKGWGLGAHEWTMCGQAPWLTPAKKTLRLLCVHQDQVQVAPPQAKLLASSPFCENAAFAIGEHIFCVQGHPEFLPNYAHALLECLKERAPAEAIEQAAATIDTPVDSDLCATWMANFFKQQGAA